MCKRKPKEKPIPELTSQNIHEVLPLLYEAKVVPVEKRHIYDVFYTPKIEATEFKATPIIMFLGQYSVGKTSMIKYFVGSEYPGSMIGPEPTTDCFTAVFYSDNPHEEMGPSLIANPTLPFGALQKFGGAFENRLRGAAVDSKILKHMTFIDTPGILAGDKQVKSRNYDFSQIIRFMADKVDLIICVFDTTKLDMSDEFKQVLKGLTGNDEKIKIVLNKADCVSPSELVRVRGALMWGLSKIIDTPEVPKVYIGSFTDELKNPNIMSVFKSDYMDLFHEIEQTPTRSLARKVNDMIKRAKKVKLHARIMTEIMRLKRISKGNGPPMKALTTPVVKLAFFNVQKDLAITDYDMPNFQNFLEKGKLTQAKHWNKINKKEMEKLDQFILQDIPKMLQLLPHDEKNTESMKDAFARLRDIVEKANEEEKKSDETSKKGSKKESKKESKKDRSKKKDKSKSRSKSKSKEEKSKEDSKKKNKSKDKSDKRKAEKKEDEKSKGEKKEDKSKAEKKEEKSKSEVKDEKSKGEKKDEKSKGEKKEEKEKEEKKDEKSKGEKKEEKEKSKSEAQEDKDKSKAEKKD